MLLNNKTKSLAYSALFCSLIAICSWICIPTPLPFTLQTFGVYCACFILGSRRALYCVITYIASGAVGAPVFSGFRGGFDSLLGATGGYIWGFLFIPLCCMIISEKSKSLKVIALSVGTLLCYTAGTLQYVAVYMNGINTQNILTAVIICVLPYVIPDIIKFILAAFISNRLSQCIKIQ